MKKQKFSILVIVTFGLVAVPTVFAQGCCGGASAAHDSHATGAASGDHSSHCGAQTAVGTTNSAPHAALMQPVQSVFDNYIKVQTALTEDSLEGIAETASAMAAAIQGDSMKMLSAEVAEQAGVLAKAKDLEAARAAFKPLSESLIQYLKDNKVPAGTYHEVYCSMAKASWLQTDRTVRNPYFGKAMLRCGTIKS